MACRSLSFEQYVFVFVQLVRGTQLRVLHVTAKPLWRRRGRWTLVIRIIVASG